MLRAPVDTAAPRLPRRSKPAPCALRIARALSIASILSITIGCGAPEPRASSPGGADARDAPDGASARPGAASSAASGSAGAKGAVVGTVLNGVASYYADSLAGRSTASGEPYDPTALTAAHRSLPFGTLVEVSRGGRSVVVRINDRGPFGKKKRIIDLSRRAAEELDMVRAGVAEVTVRVIGSAKR